MRKNYWSLAICLGALVLLSGYQNCSTPADQNAYYGSVSQNVCEADCGDLDASSLYVDIKTSNPYVMQRNDMALGVSGNCAGTGFDSVRVTVVLSYTSTGQIMSTGTFNCDGLGRYAGLVHIPPSYDHSQVSLLVATVYGRVDGVDIQGASTAQITVQSAGVAN